MSNYLIHHGIKGQQWGVQNGPPYPLSASQKTYSESKVRRLTRKANKSKQESDRATIRVHDTGTRIKKALGTTLGAGVGLAGIASGNPIVAGLGGAIMGVNVGKIVGDRVNVNRGEKWANKRLAKLESAGITINEIPTYYSIKEGGKESVRYGTEYDKLGKYRNS